jgi:hypothetical protein
MDLDPLPVNRARLAVVEPALFEWDVFLMAAPIQSAAKCEVRSVIRNAPRIWVLHYLAAVGLYLQAMCAFVLQNGRQD